jgi:AGZA family xanthine/uracil permease-like MFS transporter
MPPGYVVAESLGTSSRLKGASRNSLIWTDSKLTGFSTSVVTACFAISIFASPFVAAIPPQAYSPALIAVGLFMLAPIRQIDFEDYSESVPSFAVVALTCFTFNIAIGITAGFVLYPLCKLVAGKAREIRPGLWLLTALSLLFFVFYPYR